MLHEKWKRSEIFKQPFHCFLKSSTRIKCRVNRNKKLIRRQEKCENNPRIWKLVLQCVKIANGQIMNRWAWGEWKPNILAKKQTEVCDTLQFYSQQPGVRLTMFHKSHHITLSIPDLDHQQNKNAHHSYLTCSSCNNFGELNYDWWSNITSK